MSAQPEDRCDPVATVRRFNRFYTRQIGLLDESLLRSSFSLTEARVLFELAQGSGLTASMLGTMLDLDAGYLSRILRRFEAKGLVTRYRSETDGRQALLTLTTKGRIVFGALEQNTRKQIGAMLDSLHAVPRDRLLGAMRTIERLLGRAEEPDYVLRPHKVGDIGWITHRQAMLYAEEYGWDESYEALAAEILSGFVKTYDPAREQSWIAERDGEVLGSIFLMRQSDEVAKLRLLYVEPAARGLGLGRRLVGECIAAARAKGYSTLTLWTNDILVAARRIYQQAGFKLVDEAPHHSFGKDLVGQTWTLDLRG